MTELVSTSGGSADDIQRRLRNAWGKERRFVHTRGLCSLLLWALALLGVDLLIDWLFLIPGLARVALLAANLGVLAWVAWRNWVLHLRRFDPVRVALQVERRHPELHNLLVSFVQLRGPAQDAAISPSLLEAFQKQALDQAAPLNFKEIINYRELKRLFLVSFCAVAVFGLASFQWGEFFNILLYRLLDPRTTRAYPTRVHFVDVTGDRKVPYGKEIAIAATCSGALPMEGTLRIKTALSKGWESLPLPQSPEGRYAHKFDGVFQDFEYEIRVGDARSDKYKVTVIPPPRIAKSRVFLKYPPYTGLKDAEIGDLNLQVPEGTQITWRLSYDMPLLEAFLVRENPDASVLMDPASAPAASQASRPLGAPMKLEKDAKTVTYSMTAGESYPYHIRWTDQQFKDEHGSDMRYMLQVDADVPPEVDILYPTSDGKATVNKTLTVKFKADDNYGLTGLFMVYSLNDGAEKRVPLEKLSGKEAEHEVHWAIRGAIPDLKEGDTLTWSLEIADNHDKAPLLGRSRSFRLSIVSQAEYLRYVFEEHARVMKEVEAMRQDESAASQQVGTIENPTSMPATAPAGQ